jgi:hypothetical protein
MKAGFRVVHFSVQHNHIHMIVEGDSRRLMANGLRQLLSRSARALNAVMAARGARFDDRYHEHVLRTPTETRNALRYVIGNRDVHLTRWGKASEGADPFSSLGAELGVPARSWLLREGWTRAGPLEPAS